MSDAQAKAVPTGAPFTHPREWQVLRLRDICLKIGSGATPTGGQATYLAEREAWALVRSQNVLDRQFDASGLAYISDEQAATLSGVALQAGDVLLNITGDGVTFARSCEVPQHVLPAVVNQHVSIIRVKPELADSGYVLAYLTHPTVKDYIEGFNAGGSRRAITKGHIESFQIPLPKLEQQQTIVHILGTLDDKIELNRRMNETLEAMARAIFKSWFVDFDPVRAKASGEPSESICRRLGLTPDVLALFPDSFQDSELGEIPAGWSSPSLYEMAAYINGAAYSAFEPNAVRSGLPIIKIAELKAGVTEQTKYSTVEMPEKYLIDRGDILFSWSGNPDTSIDTFVWTNGPAWLNQHIFRVVPPDELERPFVLAMLKSLRPVFAEIARNKQTTGLGHVTVSDLKRLRCVKPPKSLLVRWNESIDPIQKRAFMTELEMQTLANLRDTVLPQLLSGNLSVSHVQNEMATAV